MDPLLYLVRHGMADKIEQGIANTHKNIYCVLICSIMCKTGSK